MLLLSPICALIAILLVAIVAVWHRQARDNDGLAQEKALYAGFAADLERRLATGDIDDDQAQEERAEAGRALLRASAAAAAVAPPRPIWLMAATIAVAAVTFALYVAIGHPSLSDQPYKSRLAQWTRVAASDPASLPMPAVAAVLRQDAAKSGGSADYWLALGRADMLDGDTYSGLKDYQRALAVSPKGQFRDWSLLGEAMTLRRGATDPEAEKAFDAALALDPHDTRALYYLGRMEVSQGRFDAARTHFRLALGDLAADDIRRPQIEAELNGVAPQAAADQAARARIAGMVASLDAQLRAVPDNADGWARLLRSYDVLGDTVAHAAAVKAVEAHFPPAQAAAIVTRSRTAVGAEDTGGQP